MTSRPDRAEIPVTLRPGMTDYIAEIPSVLAAGATELRERTEQLVAGISPVDRIDLVGSGTSLHAALAVRAELEARLGIEVRALTPSDHLTAAQPRLGPGTVTVGISQTGRSTGTLQVLDRARTAGSASVLVTGWADSVGAGHADAVLDIGCGPEWVGARTKGYVATLRSLFALSDALATAIGQPPTDPVAGVDLAGATAAVMTGTRARLDELAGVLDGAPAIWLVSYGIGMATAREAALKLLETVRVPVPVFDVEEYMHGPYHCLEADTRVAFVAPDDAGRDRYLRLVDFVAERSEHVLVVEPEHLVTPAPATRLATPRLPTRFDPVTSIIPFQLLAAELTWRKGREPGVSRYPDFHDRLASKTPAPTAPVGTQTSTDAVAPSRQNGQS